MALPIASVVAGSIIDPTVFGNEVVDALNAAPRGRVGYAQVVANQTGITTVVDLTGLTVTFTAAAGRRYRISMSCKVLSTVVGDAVKVAITDSGGTEIQNAEIINQSGATGQSMGCAVVLVPGAGSVTYKLRATRTSGTGSVSVLAGATSPAFILAEDIGT